MSSRSSWRRPDGPPGCFSKACVEHGCTPMVQERRAGYCAHKSSAAWEVGRSEPVRRRCVNPASRAREMTEGRSAGWREVPWWTPL